jgi:hypothetical protein
MAHLDATSPRTLPRIAVALCAVVAIAVLGGVTADRAAAGVDGYCYQWVNLDYTCTGEWHHLVENAATTQGAGSLCIDEYLDPSGSGYYTTATCTTGSTAQYPGSTWGYGRAWETSSPSGFINAAEVY